MIHNCPYCEYTVSHGTALSSLNRHLKQEAKKPDNKRGKHPAENDAEFAKLAKERNFRSNAQSIEEQQERRVASIQRYKDNLNAEKERRKRRDEDKVRCALVSLRFARALE